jgi:hypothetical protein
MSFELSIWTAKWSLDGENHHLYEGNGVEQIP